MEWWFIAFMKIILINIILSGDNAIVIAMASRNLPESQRKIAIFWGTFGAIGLRIGLTAIAIYLLKIPYLTAFAAILLIWIAFKLVLEDEKHQDIQASHVISSVIMTIILADFIMSLDNVLAITAVAEGNILLIFIGLLLSIPLIIWGSTVILNMIEKYPFIIYLGAAVLGFTAGEMFMRDEKVVQYLGQVHLGFEHFIPLLTACCIVIFGWISNRLRVACQ